MRTPNSKHRARVAAVVIAAATSVALAGCVNGPTGPGGGPETAVTTAAGIYAQFENLTGAEREEALVAAAQQEGSISLYTTNSNVDDIVDGFSDKYDIDVQTYRAGSDAMIQRLLQEQDAGFYGADVVEDADAGIIVREGLAHDYINEERTSQIADFETAGGIVPTRKSVYVVTWNTDLVDEAELPDTLEGFTDPKWAGRLSMEASDWAWYMALTDIYTKEGKSQDEIDAIFAGLAANSSVASGHTFQGELLGAGEFDVALSLYTRTVDRDADDGVPIAYRKADGSVIGPNVYLYDGAVPLATAPHPAGALLLIDYMLSDEGMQILADSGWPTAVPQDDRIDGIDLTQVSVEDYFGNGPEWQDKYENVIAGRETVG